MALFENDSANLSPDPSGNPTWIYISLNQPQKYWSCFKGETIATWPERLTMACSVEPHQSYLVWLPFQVFLLAALFLFIVFSLIKPMTQTVKAYRFHRNLLQEKYRNSLSLPLALAAIRFDAADDVQDQMLAIDTISKLSGMYEEIRSMPPVPVRFLAGSVFSITTLYSVVMSVLPMVAPAEDFVGQLLSSTIEFFSKVTH